MAGPISFRFRSRASVWAPRWLPATTRFGLIVTVASVFRAVPCSAAQDLVSELDMRGTVTIGQAIEAALAHNPELIAAQTDIGIRDALALQAGLRPNPGIGFEAEDVPGSRPRTGLDAGQATLSLSQLFELGGKRRKRRRAAELERDLVAWDIRVLRRALIADVTKAFARTLVVQERLVLVDELLRITQGSVHRVEATVKAGRVSPVEQSRAEVNLSRARAARLTTERELAEARIVLAATWGSRAPAFDRVAGRLEAIGKPPDLQALLPRVQTIPDLARFETELAQRRAALAREQAGRIPDVTLTAGGRQYTQDGGGALVFGFSLPLPLSDRNQGNILAAARAVTRVRREQNAAVVTAESRARQAYAAVETAYEHARVLRDETIPRAVSAYEGAQFAYTRGLFRYLEVLDAQRTLFEVRAEYLDVLALYYEASAELARWVDDSDVRASQDIEGGHHE